MWTGVGGGVVKQAQARTGGVGSRKPRVPCENVAIAGAAVAGLGTICAPSRMPSAFAATQTHMDTQRYSLFSPSLPPSLLADVQPHTLTRSVEEHTEDCGARDEKEGDEFVDHAVNTTRLDDDADVSVMTSEAPLVSKRASCDLTFTRNHI